VRSFIIGSYSSPDIIRHIKSRRIRWAGHVARVGDERGVQGFGGKPEGDNWEDRGVDARMRSEWILRRLVGVWSGFSWLRIGTGGGLL
jgi:hypothetical protein